MVITHRRRLHQIPELNDQLPETCAYVRSVLEPLDCEVFSPAASSVCAWFDFGKAESIAFRADMDALSVTEQTDLPYRSQHPGCMHACGHDGHTAILLALAESLRDLSPPHNVLLLFQPAEEGSGGAEPLCQTGILEKYHVKRIFGLHIWPNLEEGKVFTRPGPMMARSCEVTVYMKGKSVHLSRIAQGRDAMLAGIDYLQKAYAMMDSLPATEPQVLHFGKMVSGTARNALSGETVLEGSMRLYRDEVFEQCMDSLREIGDAVAAETGCTVHVKFSAGYPAVWNHEGLYKTVCGQLGSDAPALLDEPSMASEDFSFYQKNVPGLFFFLGAGAVPELHSPDFHFDDTVILPKGLAFWQRLLMLPCTPEES